MESNVSSTVNRCDLDANRRVVRGGGRGNDQRLFCMHRILHRKPAAADGGRAIPVSLSAVVAGGGGAGRANLRLHGLARAHGHQSHLQRPARVSLLGDARRDMNQGHGHMGLRLDRPSSPATGEGEGGAAWKGVVHGRERCSLLYPARAGVLARCAGVRVRFTNTQSSRK